MLRVVAVLAALAVGATAVYAQNAGAIAQRQATMKEFAEATKVVGPMMKGEVPFDLAKVQASLKVIETTAIKGKSVFPDDSKVGDTYALPAAFENKADLFARFDKLAAEAKAAQASMKDEASFKASMGKLISGNCISCHKQYQKPSQ
ncbi:MAG: cytochrome c [Hyphomicrobiaceae bacterium]|nr:MAG: cytochrome c [Hyphomicrobiaceae bacterium]